MRKMQILLWADSASPEFFGSVLAELPQALLALRGLSRLQFNLADGDVDKAADKQIASGEPLFDVMCSFYVDGDADLDRAINLLAAYASKLAVYQVEAEEPLSNTRYPAAAGQRTPGFSQVALLRCPSFLSYEQWLGYWKNTHTQIAIDIQSTFRYVQNRVVSGLSQGGVAYQAIVEECFPEAAMTSAEAFYNAEGRPELCQQRMQQMMESCAKFIDFSEIDVLPTSEYCF
ncbi:EthD domain-containing protein [Spongiibacter sp.]|uniref:EthD domain-containing protein n=1 Tax=Spongiibacter sp. TaxID=2024860 RepID=UPI003563D1EF